MPPSPVPRCSPGREFRVENHHKRGHSLESGLRHKVEDDDLVLFNDMEMKERDNFLLHPSDDFDDSLSKLRCISDLKLGITIPTRGEGNSLLNAEGGKNDYDWLLTPPDTPLFPSLDDDEPQPINLASRGRPRSQPISISRSSMAENNQRTGRSSASPHRLSPSPRSSNNTVQSQGRPSSAPRTSSTPGLRPITPSRRPSTPPNKPSAFTARSSTPTLRRMSTGSNGQLSSGRRAASPIKANYANSASPKLHGWSSNLPGFSSEAPPNLRTSLSDRPVSHTRGLSPSSSNGRDSSTKFGRQSLSPTASRSVSSSNSHNRDRLSPQSKGSVVSSGDDDVDSLHSITLGISCSPMGKKNGVFINDKGMAASKKPSRTPISSSAPKRSFDSAIRQMDHRKTPQNMFRPLLSSVPATSFYVGKANTVHRPVFSRNSSLTTSSNASSEHGASFVPDTEGSDHEQNDIVGEWEKTVDPVEEEELFLFENVDVMSRDCNERIQTENGNLDGSMSSQRNFEEFGKLSASIVVSAVTTSPSESSYADVQHSEFDHNEMTATCSKCRKLFHIMEAINGKTDICRECAETVFSVVPGTTLLVPQNTKLQSEMTITIDESCDGLTTTLGAPELPRENSFQPLVCKAETNVEQGTDIFLDSCPMLVTNEGQQCLPDQKLEVHRELASTQPDNIDKFQRSQTFSSSSSLNFDGPEATGISVLLLKRSSSNMGPLVQGRVFTATNILCAEPSYARDNMNVMKASIGRDSSSASSSIDMGSSRQTDARVQRQLSSRKNDMDNLKLDLNTKSLSSGRSLSGISYNSNETLVGTFKSRSEENFDWSAACMQHDDLGETITAIEEHNLHSQNSDFNDEPSASTRSVIPQGEGIYHSDNCRVMDASPTELSSHTESICLENALAKGFENGKDCDSHVNAEDLQHNPRSIADEVILADIADSVTIEEDMVNNNVDGTAAPDVAMQTSSGEIVEPLNDHDLVQGSLTGCEVSRNTNSVVMESYHRNAVSATSENDFSVSALEPNNMDEAHCISEESTVTVEGPRGQKSRSLTLEEATDTILFCSSIIHDLAYNAAAIGMEKEQQSAPIESFQLTPTLLGKPVFDQKEPRRPYNRRTPKSKTVKRKRLETDAKVPPAEPENKVKIQELPTCDSELPNKVETAKPQKLESKCNCRIM